MPLHFHPRMPLDDIAWFYGRTDTLDRLFGYLNKPNPQNLSIVGQRRIGKSWLLQRVVRDTALHKRLLGEPEHFSFIYWDLQSEPQLDQPIFFQRLVELILRHVPQPLADDCRALYDPAKIEDSLTDILDLLKSESHRVVLCIDEFAAITRSKQFAEDFFAHLRSLFQQPALTCVTASYRSLGELCHLGPDSPFFNIFTRIQIGLLENPEARQFITESFAAAGVTVEEQAVSEVIRLAGPHPCFMSQLCADLSRNLPPGAVLSQALVEQQRGAFETAVFDDFSYYVQRLRQDHAQAFVILQTIAANPPAAHVAGPAYTQLRDLGLVREARGKLEPFSELFREFVLHSDTTNTYFEQAFANPKLVGPNFVRMCEIILAAASHIPNAIKEDLAEAIRTMSHRPHQAMQICGRDVLEPLMSYTYQAIGGGRWNRDQYDTCKQFDDRARAGKFPKHLAAHFTSIRIYGNHGSHPDEYREACTPARAFLTVIESIHLAEEVFLHFPEKN